MTDAERLAHLKAIPPGVLETSFGGQTVSFESTEKLEAAIARLEAKIAATTDSPRPRHYVIVPTMGL